MKGTGPTEANCDLLSNFDVWCGWPCYEVLWKKALKGWHKGCDLQMIHNKHCVLLIIIIIIHKAEVHVSPEILTTCDYCLIKAPSLLLLEFFLCDSSLCSTSPACSSSAISLLPVCMSQTSVLGLHLPGCCQPIHGFNYHFYFMIHT